jgi:carbon monoxide dehydrogenase subunit G
MMANRLEATILINKPAEDVFTFLHNPDNHPKFVPGMLEFKKTSPGPIERVGTSVQGAAFLGKTNCLMRSQNTSEAPGLG